MRKILIIFILISGCSIDNNKKINNFSSIQYSENLSLEEFRIKLEKYSIENPYPNIDD